VRLVRRFEGESAVRVGGERASCRICSAVRAAVGAVVAAMVTIVNSDVGPHIHMVKASESSCREDRNWIQEL
jgi:hypothetical protein